ncbi:S8 family peptidase [Lacibacter sediminis]|uniref:S8 family serine peptidase n=1 Tax=Lacibacter sediminis TaxID=2760713 RepID=A0A7G5XC35_9BACT|nr:S8 family peptidase [Lacibacter sediminis]QNA43038.1 S8 family serine peptidase [Lacibacter sediminis]
MQLNKVLLVTSVFALSSICAFSQASVKEDQFKGWHLKNQSSDGFYGISLEQALEFVKNKKSTTVIVAVIDSGIDTLHEDLKPVLWRNPKEIPNNGIDDDKNGYVDDYYGWNFLGGKDGKNVKEDSYEAARLYHALKPKYGGTVDESKLSAIEKEEYRIFKKAQGDIEHGSTEAQTQVVFLKSLYNKSTVADSILKLKFKPEYTGNDLATFKPANSKEADAKSTMFALFKGFELMDANNDFIIKEFTSYYQGQEKKASASTSAPKDYRGEIVKDNYYDFNDRFYGNPDVMANTPFHGTHVAGIIAAARNNGIGVDGVANDVRIMTIRAVPDGDEHDKDIALAIRYAVDNGAKIINMSFGKSFSPQKKWVDDAVRYAQSKGVLLVHAAGNDGKNVDSSENYPNPNIVETKMKAPNFITVGASGDPKTGGLAADFSNYGKKEVDVFAPGVKIYSTIPGGNTYGFAQGTSMASPVVAGLAAFILSYYPDLSPEQVKFCIEKGSVNPNMQVTKPGSEEKEDFANFSRTGGLLNAYEAIKVAATLKGERNTTAPAAPKPQPKPKVKKSKKG